MNVPLTKCAVYAFGGLFVGLASVLQFSRLLVGSPSSGDGAEIGSVKSGTPADTAGLQAGDVVTAIDGDAVTSADDLTAKISAHQPGDKVTLTVTRNGATKKIVVTLGTRPS